MSPPGVVERALAEPTARVARELLAAEEDQWFDRKSARIKPRALADALVAFANADGGVIVVGLSDGRVEGTDSLGRARNDLVQAAFDFCVPPVRADHRLVPCMNDAGRPDHLLVLDVRPTEGAVHATRRDEVFLRVGDENRRLTFAQRQELTFDRGPVTYEARPLPGASRDGFDAELLDRYVTAVGASDADRLLQARGLLAGDEAPNVAGWLLFGEHPQALLPEAHVRVLRYQGSERGAGARQRLLFDERCEGPIPRMLVEARARVREVQPMRRALGGEGRFEDVALVPEDAWLEGLVNAVVHRSYSLAGDHVRVEVFDDRIEVASPGRFPGIVDLADPLTAPRFARNPRIARVCADLKFGQELGEGIRRIYEEMRHAGLNDPVYTQSAASVRLLLSAEPADRRLDARLTPQARKVTAALRDAGRLSTGEIAELLQRSRPAAIRVLRKLEAAELIRWVGKSPQDPRAYWEVVRR
ncbi:MAG: putative DNA binding domain-containing protein [Actinobacteria bacterium]|nr:putative DNA binding domain-containing protein [Actinomycetota bacterium]